MVSDGAGGAFSSPRDAGGGVGRLVVATLDGDNVGVAGDATRGVSRLGQLLASWEDKVASA